MAYITDLELGQLSAIPAEILAVIGVATKLESREAGTSKINSYLSSRYGDRLPLVFPPREIKQVNADLTGYWLMSQRGYVPESSDVAFRERYDDALLWLKDVSRGLATLDLSVITNPAPYRVARVTCREPRGW